MRQYLNFDYLCHFGAIVLFYTLFLVQKRGCVVKKYQFYEAKYRSAKKLQYHLVFFVVLTEFAGVATLAFFEQTVEVADAVEATVVAYLYN